MQRRDLRGMRDPRNEDARGANIVSNVDQEMREVSSSPEHTGEHAEGSPFQGALVMGASFGLGALVPILVYLFLPIEAAIWAAVAASAGVLFAIGVVKSRWTRQAWLRSGLEILVLGAFAGVAGFFFGNLLPTLLGVPATTL